MFIGTQLVTLASVAGTADVYLTPWFSKQADYAYFTYEIIRQNWGTAGGLTVTAYTKNLEDAGSEGTSFSFSQIGSTAFYQAACTDLKQLIRFKLSVDAGSSPSGQPGIVYRFLPPTWYNKAV